MGNELFDNLLKVIQGSVSFNAGTLVSLEIDLELPRGFVAKIRFIELIVTNIHDDIATESTDFDGSYNVALIRDPDDITTISIPNNEVQHDVIMTHSVMLILLAGAAEHNLLMSNISATHKFDRDNSDFITARNLRLNVQAEGGSIARMTDAIGNAKIYYTLEKVTDNDILNLLDIL